jgi:hypothetical protein
MIGFPNCEGEVNCSICKDNKIIEGHVWCKEDYEHLLNRMVLDKHCYNEHREFGEPLIMKSDNDCFGIIRAVDPTVNPDCDALMIQVQWFGSKSNHHSLTYNYCLDDVLILP